MSSYISYSSATGGSNESSSDDDGFSHQGRQRGRRQRGRRQTSSSSDSDFDPETFLEGICFSPPGEQEEHPPKKRKHHKGKTPPQSHHMLESRELFLISFKNKDSRENLPKWQLPSVKYLQKKYLRQKKEEKKEEEESAPRKQLRRKRLRGNIAKKNSKRCGLVVQTRQTELVRDAERKAEKALLAFHEKLSQKEKERDSNREEVLNSCILSKDKKERVFKGGVELSLEEYRKEQARIAAEAQKINWASHPWLKPKERKEDPNPRHVSRGKEEKSSGDESSDDESPKEKSSGDESPKEESLERKPFKRAQKNFSVYRRYDSDFGFARVQNLHHELKWWEIKNGVSDFLNSIISDLKGCPVFPRVNRCPGYTRPRYGRVFQKTRYKFQKGIIPKPCTHYLKGNCRYGTKCRNPHFKKNDVDAHFESGKVLCEECHSKFKKEKPPRKGDNGDFHNCENWAIGKKRNGEKCPGWGNCDTEVCGAVVGDRSMPDSFCPCVVNRNGEINTGKIGYLASKIATEIITTIKSGQDIFVSDDFYPYLHDAVSRGGQLQPNYGPENKELGISALGVTNRPCYRPYDPRDLRKGTSIANKGSGNAANRCGGVLPVVGMRKQERGDIRLNMAEYTSIRNPQAALVQVKQAVQLLQKEPSYNEKMYTVVKGCVLNFLKFLSIQLGDTSWKVIFENSNDHFLEIADVLKNLAVSLGETKTAKFVENSKELFLSLLRLYNEYLSKHKNLETAKEELLTEEEVDLLEQEVHEAKNLFDSEKEKAITTWEDLGTNRYLAKLAEEYIQNASSSSSLLQKEESVTVKVLTERTGEGFWAREDDSDSEEEDSDEEDSEDSSSKPNLARFLLKSDTKETKETPLKSRKTKQPQTDRPGETPEQRRLRTRKGNEEREDRNKDQKVKVTKKKDCEGPKIGTTKRDSSKNNPRE